MERLAELLFILASKDRLTLLSEIHNMKLRASQLAVKLSATPQETSKHLMRLRDAKIIEKDSDGLFSLTEFGKIVVNLVPSFRFLAQNREYFLSHDISSLPLEFIEVWESCKKENIRITWGQLSHIYNKWYRVQRSTSGSWQIID